MHARLKNEFTEDDKCHNLMSWLIYGIFSVCLNFSNIYGMQRYSGKPISDSEQRELKKMFENGCVSFHFMK